MGGTLTDGIFTEGDHVVCVKVDSTPHDLTVCLFDCLTQAATKLGFDGALQFLENVELIRWSTTITSNVLAEYHGPRIGLLVSRGHEKDLYGEEPRSMVLDRLLADKDVIGIGEEAGETEVMNAARSLLESAARRICVSLKDAGRHPERERWVKRIIDEQYPDHFLGSVPVLAGSDISKAADDSTRTYCVVINAYTHGALAATLFKAEDELQQNYGYLGSFLVSHINGGVAGVEKTKAIDTIESGPILGIHGSRHMAKIYALQEVVAQERCPSFRRLRIWWRLPQAAQHGSFRNLEARHLQLAANARNAPDRVLRNHAQDQIAQFLACRFPSDTNALARDPFPIRLEPGAMPTNDRLRLHEDQCASPSRPQSSKHRPEQFVWGDKPRLRVAPSQNRELLPQSQVLQKKITTRAKELGSKNKKKPD